VDAVLAQLGLVRGGYVVMAPGAEFGPAKRWPHFGALAALLDRPVVLLGSGKEADLCEAIAAQAPQRCRNLAGKTSLLEAFALIAGAGQVVSNDSGLMHVAAAFGVPQVALFGSSSPLHTPPLNANATVVWLNQDPAYLPPLDCSPCFQRECPLGHFRCLNDVSPQRVLGLL
jgi:heptosyltransferase-2